MTERPSILVPVRVLEGESIPRECPNSSRTPTSSCSAITSFPTRPRPDRPRYSSRNARGKRPRQVRGDIRGRGCHRRAQARVHPRRTEDDRPNDHRVRRAGRPRPERDAPPEDVLVAVRGAVGVDRLARVVAGLFADAGVEITLFHVAEADETADDVQTFPRRRHRPDDGPGAGRVGDNDANRGGGAPSTPSSKRPTSTTRSSWGVRPVPDDVRVRDAGRPGRRAVSRSCARRAAGAVYRGRRVTVEPSTSGPRTATSMQATGPRAGWS